MRIIGNKNLIKEIYQELYAFYGPQKWWPADTRFEMVVGAILTQNTAWENVEKAILNLKPYLKPEIIFNMDDNKLAELIRPSGYYNIKTKRIKYFLHWFKDKEFSFKNLMVMNTENLRNELLKINGIGRETADSIILYALDKPVFVIDAYTRRFAGRASLFEDTGPVRFENTSSARFVGNLDYDQLQRLFESNLERDAALFNEYHALIVRHSKNLCAKKPDCSRCFLNLICKFNTTKLNHN